MVSLCNVPESKNKQQENKSSKGETNGSYLALRQKEQQVSETFLFLIHYLFNYFYFNIFEVINLTLNILTHSSHTTPLQKHFSMANSLNVSHLKGCCASKNLQNDLPLNCKGFVVNKVINCKVMERLIYCQRICQVILAGREVVCRKQLRFCTKGEYQFELPKDCIMV